MEIDFVREITETMEIQPIPESPDYIEGVANIRGEVIPVINLKKRLNIREEQASKRLLVINADVSLLSFLVDEASQVIDINNSDIQEPNKIMKSMDNAFVEGIGIVKNELYIILNSNKICSL
jgi:purine-binding chemotaxis protein CheW